jgi:ubiquinone/menaquinone biosynthesis C-methylase UbiE
MTQDFYDEVYRVDHPSQYGGKKDGMPQRTNSLTPQTTAWLEQIGFASWPEAKILEIGCGMAFLAKVHPGWHGVEYSRTAVARVKSRDGNATKIFEGDAQCLPFADASFDGIYTWAALEHVPDPNKAFVEIDRVLRGGGVRLDCAGLELPLLDCQEDRVAAGV